MTVSPLAFGNRAPLPRPAPRSVAMNATLVRVVEVSSTIRRLCVRPDDGVPSFVAGQYFALGIEADGRLLQRPYSTATGPGERETLEFLVRHVAAGQLTPRLWTLAAGSRVRLGPPKGLFALAADDPRTHLFVATGTGIAPIISMLSSIAARRVPPTVRVVQGAARPEELAYAVPLRRRLGPGYLPTVSRGEEAERAGWAGAVGRVGAVLEERWANLCPDPGATVAYLCGNPQMIATVRALLEAGGLAPDSVRAEEYWTAPVASLGPDARS